MKVLYSEFIKFDNKKQDKTSVMAATVSSSTPVAAIAFRWLDILEKEFDKSYVGLDHQLAQMLNIREEDCDERVGKVTQIKKTYFRSNEIQN